MRALLTLALAAVMAAVAVDAALVLNNHPVVLEHKRRHANSVTEDSHPQFGNEAAGNIGANYNGSSTAYRLIYELGIAVVTKNYTWVNALIDDSAVIFISDISCDPLTKSQFMAALEAAPVLARYFDLGAWAGYADQSVLIRATIGAVLSSTAPIPGATVQNDDVFLFGLTNADGSQLALFEQVTAHNQANATAMLAVWKTLRDAAQLHDITPWENALSKGFGWEMSVAWGGQYVANATTFLANMQAGWATEASVYIHEYFSFAVCDMVVADILWSAIRTDGTAQMQRFAMSTGFDEYLTVTRLMEFTQMPWL